MRPPHNVTKFSRSKGGRSFTYLYRFFKNSFPGLRWIERSDGQYKIGCVCVHFDHGIEAHSHMAFHARARGSAVEASDWITSIELSINAPKFTFQHFEIFCPLVLLLVVSAHGVIRSTRSEILRDKITGYSFFP